jgi:hypothetical protein
MIDLLDPPRSWWIGRRPDFDALCAGDPDAAEAAVRTHPRSVIEALPAVDAAPGRRFDTL